MRMEGERIKAWHIGFGKGGRPSSKGSHLRGFWCLFFFFNEKEQSLGKGSRDDPRWQAKLQAVSMGKHCLPH